MMQLPLRRLLVTILAVTASAAAQSDPQSAPAPNTMPEPGSTSPAPPERVPPPQPQPAQPAQPAPAGYPPPGSGQPAPATPAPAGGNAQPYAQSYGVAANGSSRDGNSNNYQRSDNNGSAPFNNGDEAPKSSSKFEKPVMSVRVDPFNWLLAGRLGFELESQIWKFISVELVPVFIVNDQPPYLNLNFIGVPNTMYQSSAGLGAIAGTSVGVGFWLNETPMEGYVLRAEITDYAINYDSRDATGPIDHVKYLERYFQVLFGSHSKWGPVTLAGTFGLGSALNKQQRCFQPGTVPSQATAMTSGCENNKQMQLVLTRGADPAIVNLNGGLYPIDLIVRISLGVVF